MRLVACRSAGEGRRGLKKKEREVGRDRESRSDRGKKEASERKKGSKREEKGREGKSSRAPVPC